MSIKNSRGFPSILLVNFSILYTAGKTKLSKNGKKSMRFFDILSQSTKTMEQCLWLFYIASVKNRPPRENVPRFCTEPTTTSVIVRPKMCHCTISTGIIVTSCVYSFPTEKIFPLFRKVQFSVSHFIYLFIYFAMSPFF